MKVLEPGSAIGILGSGQLGRMFSFAAKRMGYRVHVFSPEQDSPAGQVSDREFVAAFEDLDAVSQFASSIDVATLEFENIPVETLNAIDGITPVRPGANVLEVTQHRIREKRLLANAGLPVPAFQAVQSTGDLRRWSTFPAVMKTATCGYDGKGQVKLDHPDDLFKAWEHIGHQEAIIEEFVDFQCELSVVAARGQNSEFAAFQPFLNQHCNHILDITLCPTGLPQTVSQEAIAITREVMATLDVVGVLCVEFFYSQDGQLLINELAPRPHNSGHLTIEACRTSQFEQQVRAVCGLPLGSTELLRPAAMANLLGDLWTEGTPDWKSVLKSDCSVHLYGKTSAKPGRKMGHVTALSDHAQSAANLTVRLREELTQPSIDNQRQLLEPVRS